jgi:hypothetical protein
LKLRRKELEAQRDAKLKQLQEKRHLKQTKIAQTLLDKEKGRIETAKAKERTREQRLATLEAQLQANKEEVKKRILQKHVEWSKRHESNLEEIRKKAFEMSILHFSVDDHNSETSNSTLYDKAKYCNICNIIIGSDAHLQSHLRSPKHRHTLNECNQGRQLTRSEVDEYNSNCLVDISLQASNKCMTPKTASIDMDEKMETNRKRLKKLKNKILSKGKAYEENCLHDKKLKQMQTTTTAQPNDPDTLKTYKNTKELAKLLQINDKNHWSQKKITQFDRIVKETCRLIDRNREQQNLFLNNDGLMTCIGLLNAFTSFCTIPAKTIASLVNLVEAACRQNYDSCIYMLFSTKLTAIFDILCLNMDSVENGLYDRQNKLIYSQISMALVQLVANVFNCLHEKRNSKETQIANRASDTIRYYGNKLLDV